MVVMMMMIMMVVMMMMMMKNDKHPLAPYNVIFSDMTSILLRLSYIFY